MSLYAHKLPSMLLMLIAFCQKLFAFSNQMAEQFLWQLTGTRSFGFLTTQDVWRLS